MVPKDLQNSPGPGTYLAQDREVTQSQNPKYFETKQKQAQNYLRNNPFGAGDPRFDH